MPVTVEPIPPTSTGTHRLDLGPSRTECFRTFRMPVLTALLGVFFLVIGLVTASGGHNLAIILGVVILALSALLIGMELHDLERAWIAWDGAALTLGRRRAAPLTLSWADIRDVRLHETHGERRRTPGRSWLYLEVRPLDWRGLEKLADASAYQGVLLSEDALGVPASAGDAWRIELDQTLRAAGLRAYAGVVSTQETDPRAVWRHPREPRRY